MKRNRGLIGLIVLLSLLVITGVKWAGWESWNSVQGFWDQWAQRPAHFRSVPLENPTLLGTFIILLTFYLCGILVLYVFPSQIRRMEDTLTDSSALQLGRVFLLGLLIAILVGTISFISAMTMSTFPLTIILGITLFLSSFVGFVAFAYALGHKLFAYADWSHLSPIYALLLGLLVLIAAAEIPFLGILFKLVFASLGIGLVIATRFGTGRPWNLAPLADQGPQN